MELGTRLKNTRMFLGLTQKEFSAGIVTESFYSRVESNQSNISMMKLIELLNYHQVPLYDFFEPAFKENIEQEAIRAFIDRDVARLRKFKKTNDNAALQLMIDILEGQTTKMKIDGILSAYVFQKHTDRLLVWCLFAYLCDLDELEKVVSGIATYQLGNLDDFSVRILVNALLVCLERYYENGKFDKVQDVLDILKRKPQRSYLSLENLIESYYLDLLSNDLVEAEQIATLLNKMNYSRHLKVSIKSN